MKEHVLKLQEVFGITNKVPNTYIKRDYVDDGFVKALERKKHIVIYGCSKQGKTSLRKKYLDETESVVIQCTNNTTRGMIYEILLKEAGAELSNSTTETSSGTKKIGVTLSGEGNVFIAKAKGEGKTEFENEKSKTITRNYFEIDPSDANDVIRMLLQTKFNKWVVIEDFHYLNDQVQEFLSADLKAFYEKTDNIRMIIIGVWLESGKLTRLNGDLDGRIEYINADTWNKLELLQVLKEGEILLKINFSLELKDKMVFYCQNNVGLLQQIAERICDKIGVTKTQSKKLLVLDDTESKKYRIQEKASELNIGDQGIIEYPIHLIARNFGLVDINAQETLNFHGGPFDKWLAELSKERSYRYASFLRDFANGPSGTIGNTFRWITYAIIKATDEELHSGLSLERIVSFAREVFDSKTIKGNYSIQNQDFRFALHEIRTFHNEMQIHPPILDYDATEDKLRIVDSGFLLYHSTNNVQQMLITIGLDPL